MRAASALHRSLPAALFAACAIACSASHKAAVSPQEKGSFAFDYVGQSWMRFDAEVAGTKTHLILDTGGGVTVLSKRLCDRIGCVPDGTFTGKRMSGQAITVSMVRVPSIVMAGHRVENARVGVLDMASLLHPELGVEGFAGLDLFRDRPFTLEYGHTRLVLEDDASLAARKKAGSVSKVRVENDGPSTVVYLPLELSPGAPALEMEVDSGSRDLILDERFMMTLGIDPAGNGVRKVEGHDETDQPFVRHFTALPRSLHVPGLAGVGVEAGKTVMFQRIVHDGLVGHDFLSAHTTTFDVPHGEMIFAPL
jgi:hypothetical protein